MPISKYQLTIVHTPLEQFVEHPQAEVAEHTEDLEDSMVVQLNELITIGHGLMKHLSQPVRLA